MQKKLFEETTVIDREKFEREYYSQGVFNIAGVDEVGRGCLAGPVVAAAVILPYPCSIQGLRDSKKLSATKRHHLSQLIHEQALAFALGIVDAQMIDTINILQASLLAMKMAVEALQVKAGLLLVDGNATIPISYQQRCLVQGDDRSVSIAAASIIAKVHRDQLMCAYEKQFPEYRFALHKGYGTAQHQQELKTHGPSALHRKSFRPVYEIMGENVILSKAKDLPL